MTLRLRCADCGQLVNAERQHACPLEFATFDPHRMVEDIIAWHSGSAYPRDRAMAARLAAAKAAA